jgi:hypothetical protein
MEPTTSPVHNRQFVLGPHAVTPKENWVAVELAEGLILSHCPKLRVATATDGDGRRWTLLGLAVQTDPSRAAPVEEIARSASADVPHAYGSWAGRWLLVSAEAIHSDAGGTLGCFYRLTPEGDLWASSSLGLLARLPGLPELAAQPRLLLHQVGYDYDPPPRTKYAAIRKMLPSQVLDPRTGEVGPKPEPVLAPPTLPYEQVLDELEATLTNALAALQGEAGQLWLALTSGYDSRLLLAVAHKAGIPVKTYTHIHPRMTRGDRDLPPLLARTAGFEHTYTWPRRLDRARLADFERHTDGQRTGPDGTYYARGQWNFCQPSDVMVRGHGSNVGRCPYRDSLPPTPPPDPATAAALILEAKRPVDADFVRESVAEYVQWAAAHPYADVDWRDRLLLELGFGGGHAALAQGLDLVEGMPIAPIIARPVFNLFLAVPESIRCRTQHQVDLIARLLPELAAFPFNPRDKPLRHRALRARRLATILRHYGPRAALYDATKYRRRRSQG